MDIKHLKKMGYKEATTPIGNKFLVMDCGESKNPMFARFNFKVEFGNGNEISSSTDDMQELYRVVDMSQETA
tara:strand:- start:475 stop:690 length:216 start_codon:yes stop_codon:yes gene_type:complete